MTPDAGERQRERVAQAWEALQMIFTAWGAYRLLVDVLKFARKK